LLNSGREKAPRINLASVTAQRRREMLETIAIILIVLWLLGLVSGYTMGNFIYILLVIAIVLFLVRLVSGRRV
jgi:low affinity Fe/Cu permease